MRLQIVAIIPAADLHGFNAAGYKIQSLLMYIRGEEITDVGKVEECW